MKALALIVLAAVPFIAIAGPEDHMYETCYTATSPVPSQIPSTFCFDQMRLNDEKNLLTIVGNFSNLPSQMKVVSSIFQTEDRLKFRAEQKIVDLWDSGCGEGLSATLKFNGVSDITQNEQINPKELEMSLEYSETNDTCHSKIQLFKVKYEISK